MVARPTGPAPITATAEPGSIWAMSTPQWPVATMSPRKSAASSVTSAGMTTHVRSAYGTRTSSAWQPSAQQPSSQPPSTQLFTQPRSQ